MRGGDPDIVDLIHKIKNDGLLKKWLMYGFHYLTGTWSQDIENIVLYLKSVRNYSDEDIMKLCNAEYSLAGMRV